MHLLSVTRAPSWRYVLLDSHDQPIRDLTNVFTASYEVVAQSPLGVSGSITLLDHGDIDYMRDRVQIIHDPGVRGVDPWPEATLRLTSPKEARTPAGDRHVVSLLSKVSVVADDTVERYSLDAGTEIIPTVVGLIRSTGESKIAATPSPAVLAEARSWDPGTPKLRIINDLLQAAGYWSLWCDGAGQFRVEPYVDLANRPVSYEFQAGQASIHSPAWEREQNMSGVPNRVKVRTHGSDTELPLVGVATNENPASPFSYQSRGNKWVDRPIETVEASSQAVVNQIAFQRLRDAMNPVARLEVTHWMVPLNPNDLVRFAPTGYETLATVQRMAVTCSTESLVRATWREVLPL